MNAPFHAVPLLAALGLLPCAPDVLELRDGSRLVGESRSTATGVVLDGALGRLHFESREIAHLERRNDLLPRVRSARLAAGEQPHALLAVATFALERGLYPEAFDALDAARAAGATEAQLADAAAELDAQALLDGCARALPPTDDAARRELLARVGGRSASRAAFATRRLLELEEQARTDFLLERLARGTAVERRGAVALLQAAPAERALGKLVRASLLDSDREVRDAARTAALASRHPQLVVAYLQALATDSSTLRQRAYPALAELRDPRAVDGLIAMLEPRAAPAGGGGSSPARAHVFFGEQRAFVQDFEVEIAQGAVIAKPVIGVLQSGVALDVAVAGVFVIRREERAVVVDALRRLTGAELGHEAAAWRSWWRAQKGELPPAAPVAEG
ncbi:MAG: hypothetical protein JNL90_08635 [Planctomycetes bacterium]|nr:hypothetical protein [Planctomycetota bacterium]